MDIVIALFSQYSMEGILVLCILMLVAFKFISELIDFAYNKLKCYFNKETQKEDWKKSISEGLQELNAQLSSVNQEMFQVTSRLEGVEKNLKLTEERLQENTRSYLIDAHHRFVYQEKAIDDLNLQSMERRYVYYKAAGGNSFIDGLMKEVRQLPKVNFYNDGRD